MAAYPDASKFEKVVKVIIEASEAGVVTIRQLESLHRKVKNMLVARWGYLTWDTQRYITGVTFECMGENTHLTSQSVRDIEIVSSTQFWTWVMKETLELPWVRMKV